MNKLRIALLLALAVACGPVHNPVSPEYPCGTRAHKCSSGDCCWNDQDCGGDVGWCPVDMCCYRGDGQGYGVSPDGGVRMTRQWSP